PSERRVRPFGGPARRATPGEQRAPSLPSATIAEPQSEIKSQKMDADARKRASDTVNSQVAVPAREDMKTLPSESLEEGKSVPKGEMAPKPKWIITPVERNRSN